MHTIIILTEIISTTEYRCKRLKCVEITGRMAWRTSQKRTMMLNTISQTAVANDSSIRFSSCSIERNFSGLQNLMLLMSSLFLIIPMVIADTRISTPAQTFKHNYTNYHAQLQHEKNSQLLQFGGHFLHRVYSTPFFNTCTSSSSSHASSSSFTLHLQLHGKWRFLNVSSAGWGW